MRLIFLALFLILSNTIYSQDFSFRTKYLTESISWTDKKTSLANVKVTYVNNILKIYDITDNKNVIEREITLFYIDKTYLGVQDDFNFSIDLKKREIKLTNRLDKQETYLFSLHKPL